MKTLLYLAAFIGSASVASATITINLTAAQLYGANGTTPFSNGMLLQLLASTTDSVFTDPSATSFVGGSGDDLVVSSYAMNSGTTGLSGGSLQSISLTLSGNFNANDPLLFRWWPALASNATTPGASQPYGEFRTTVVENGSNIAWLTPADGANVQLKYLNAAASGTEPNSTGAASKVTPVPEPGVMGLLGLASITLLRRRNRA